MNSTDGLRKLLEENGINPSSSAGVRFLRFLHLLEKWNRRINLTGSTEWSILYALFAEAMWAAQFYADEPRSHLDIGSGAGFPALPMRILRPEMNLHLVESRSRRAVFLESVVDDLGLDHVAIHANRLETFLAETPAMKLWDIVSWKALRLKRRDLQLLLHRTQEQSEFWVFHGRRLPVEGSRIEGFLELIRKESAPFLKRSYLSVYRKSRPKSHECFT